MLAMRACRPATLLRLPRRRLHSRADLISVANLQSSCVVGIYAHERQRPQPLRIDIEMEVDTRPAAHTEDCATTLDYFAVAEQARFVVEMGRFQLLETAAHAIARLLLAPAAPDEARAAAQAVRVTLTKPEALAGSAVPSVSVWRSIEHEAFEWEPRPHGFLDAVHGVEGSSGEHAAVHRLSVAPGGEVEAPSPGAGPHWTALLPLSAGLLYCGKDAASLRPIDLLQGRPGVLLNPTRRHHTVLCVRAGSDLEAPHFDGPGHDAAP